MPRLFRSRNTSALFLRVSLWPICETQVAAFELELTTNAGREQAYELGDGYGHLALAVDDLEAAHRQVENAGGSPTPIKSLDYDGKMMGRFFFASDPDGYKIEVLAREGRFS